MSAPESPVEPFKRAVTAATRAIAADSELDVSFGAEGTAGRGGRGRLPLPSRTLPESEVAQVRGAGDALALWTRHHDDRLHSRFRPQSAIPRAVFEAAEQARVEAIGANRMRGVSANLDAMLEERCRARGIAAERPQFSICSRRSGASRGGSPSSPTALPASSTARSRSSASAASRWRAQSPA